LITAAEREESSLHGLDRAEEHLRTGYGLNWVPDEMRAGLHWAMEAWLLKQGHKPKSDWQSMMFQFLELAPKPLRSEASYLLSSFVFLESDLMGAPELEASVCDTATLDQWKEKAQRLLAKTRGLVTRMARESATQNQADKPTPSKRIPNADRPNGS